MAYERARVEGVWIKPEAQTDGQGFWLFPSLHLIGSATEHGVHNGQLYVVKGLGEGSVHLQVMDSEREVELQLCSIKCVKPAHALCYYAAQGRTLRGRVRLWVHHPHLSTTHLVVGLSRATASELVDTA